MNQYYIDAPAHWANYLINGDAEGFNYDEHEEILSWLHGLPNSIHTCLGIYDPSEGESDAHFMGRFDFPRQGRLLTTMYTYIYTEDSK